MTEEPPIPNWVCVDGIGCLFGGEVGLDPVWWFVQITFFPIFMLFVLNHFIFIEKWDDITSVWYWFGEKILEARDYIVGYGFAVYGIIALAIVGGATALVFASSGTCTLIIALELVELED